jgi:uncharacterized protein YfaP (DUF2135 family)
MRTPDGNIIYYNAREVPNVSLDRDSRGFLSNRTYLLDGSVVYSSNHEVIAIRAIWPGEYLVAVSYYSGGFGGDVPIDASVDVEKVNPVLTDIVTKHLHFDKVKQTLDVVKFRIEPNGAVTLLPLSGENMIQQHRQENPTE